MYYSVKLSWTQPKEGTDEDQKLSKCFLVYAESVTEAEAKTISWVPANYQEPIVEEVKKTTVGELKIAGLSETFWSLKIMEDSDGKSKPKPYFVVYNGNTIDEVIKIAVKDWAGAEIEEVKKFKIIVDDDLISSAVLIKKVLTAIDDEDDEEDI